MTFKALSFLMACTMVVMLPACVSGPGFQKTAFKQTSIKDTSSTSNVTTFVSNQGGGREVTLTMEWEPNVDLFYTPRGVPLKVQISEGNAVIEPPADAFRASDDFNPEGIELWSDSKGNYDLWVPNGVGAGLGMPPAFVIRDFQYQGKYKDTKNPRYISSNPKPQLKWTSEFWRPAL